MGLYALPWGQESWAKLQDRDGKHGKPEFKKKRSTEEAAERSAQSEGVLSK